MKTVIGICGQARSGKDTIADMLVSNYNFKKIAFADKLKGVLRYLFFFSEQQLYGDLKECIDPVWNKSPRVIMQKVGDNLRSIDKSIWIKQIEKTIKEVEHNKFVISDVRYNNEIEFIKNIGGQVWLVKRFDAPKIDGSFTHPSEIEMLEVPEQMFDNVIINETIDSTKDIVDNILKGNLF